jgi:hypothetical protein
MFQNLLARRANGPEPIRRFGRRYQLALITPGISPLSASVRKHIRHISNFRK